MYYAIFKQKANKSKEKESNLHIFFNLNIFEVYKNVQMKLNSCTLFLFFRNNSFPTMMLSGARRHLPGVDSVVSGRRRHLPVRADLQQPGPGVGPASRLRSRYVCVANLQGRVFGRQGGGGE